MCGQAAIRANKVRVCSVCLVSRLFPFVSEFQNWVPNVRHGFSLFSESITAKERNWKSLAHTEQNGRYGSDRGIKQRQQTTLSLETQRNATSSVVIVGHCFRDDKYIIAFDWNQSTTLYFPSTVWFIHCYLHTYKSSNRIQSIHRPVLNIYFEISACVARPVNVPVHVQPVL